LPRVAQIDERYRGQGLAVLGISLDQPRTTVGSVASFVKERKMTWDQVYRDAPQIAMQYGVFSIPAAFLVDGDTGAILASGDELRGDLLQKTVEAQLKTRKP
jgi:peroxiredoxin